MSKSRKELIIQEEPQLSESQIFERVAAIIETRKSRAGAYANREVTLMYWEVGQYIGSITLGGERAEYGKRIVATLAHKLTERYGNSFERSKITRMVKFARLFPDLEIVAPLAHQLCWSHFQELLPVKSDEARIYYAQDAVDRRLSLGVRHAAFEKSPHRTVSCTRH